MAQGSFIADVDIPDTPRAPDPSRAQAVQARIDADNARAAEAAKQKGGDFDWRQLGMMAGGGLLAHALASSLVDNKSDEEKRRQSIWERLLAGIIPIGAAGLGAWGGHYLNTKIGAAGYVVDGTTNRYDRVSGNIPYARRIVKEVVDSAGGPHETLPLGPRMRYTAEKDLIPQAEGAKGDAESWRNWALVGAVPSALGTALAGKKWWDYAGQEAELAKAREIMNQQQAATEAAGANAEALRQHQGAIDAKERQLQRQEKRFDKAEGIRMGKNPTGNAAKTLANANSQIAKWQKKLHKLRTRPPTQQPVNFPTQSEMARATKVLESQPLAPRKVTPRRVAKGATLAGAGLTAGLVGASMYNNYVANEQQERLEALQNLSRGLPQPVKK